MAKEIKFSLLYRDMWQSSGKYVPTVEQLLEVAPAIVDMGCFARVETNGGGFEQINLLFGENPNVAVRKWTQPFNDAGIQTHMLERGLNGIRMSPVPADIRRLMFRVKKKQGTDIARSFDGLNDPRNLESSIKFAKEAGMISQAALSLTVSEVHTVEYYTKLADTLIEMGADEICMKDMAGIARPASVGKIIKNIKDRHPDIPITYHGHAGPGFQMASILEAAYAGVDYVDTAMEPLAWGTGHADVLAIQAMLKDAGFNVPDINMKAYMKVRSLTQKYIDDFLGYYINPKNRLMNSLLIGPGLPGGMMGSLMADLESNLESLNKWLAKNDKQEITLDDLLIKLFKEVAYVWPKIGNPPLVTPFSQYVKNLALMNVMQMERGKERWSIIADNIWDMILGRAGKLPGTLAPEIVQLIKEQGREFYDGNPQNLYPDQLNEFRAEMKKNNWDFGQDDEELFELAMHPEQYRAYKSGAAKTAFEQDLAKRRAATQVEKPQPAPVDAPANGVTNNFQPRQLVINVDNEEYMVYISYPENDGIPFHPVNKAVPPQPKVVDNRSDFSNGKIKEVISPLEGKFYLTKDPSETPLKVGAQVKVGEIIGYIESMKTYNAIAAEESGKVTEICFSNGDLVEEDDILVKLN
ncbi:MAG TPA: oxaloacetate decarboxylase [Petrimonas sp.]|uniref:biotin/lipoyl-containing protein n=1 Tax=Petrimonas sp. TaxID=2023866 RepID=UPI0009595EF6|nr:biotin/lipoyl-containing protein [Petrimonas sp.]OJV36204.1 MAG: oxaloacetate decarboxylase [Bacteroidia bacterium 43-41]HHV85124.1 oxaloacetate decarboxylase [Petrimonas sp.]